MTQRDASLYVMSCIGGLGTRTAPATIILYKSFGGIEKTAWALMFISDIRIHKDKYNTTITLIDCQFKNNCNVISYQPPMHLLNWQVRVWVVAKALPIKQPWKNQANYEANFWVNFGSRRSYRNSSRPIWKILLWKKKRSILLLYLCVSFIAQTRQNRQTQQCCLWHQQGKS